MIRPIHAAFLMIIMMCGCLPVAKNHDLLESALNRAGDNASQLRKALNEVPDSQAEGLLYLIAYMPERDLKSLSAKFLLNNVNFAYRAWNEAPWKQKVPEAIFWNDILPYASVDERRDDWREEFYTQFKPLVKDAQSPSEAAVLLNREIFKKLGVCFSRKRPKANQSPYESIEASMASCTGMSILLIDACRAVGIPARLAGTPQWADNSGNHSWVEIWDGTWHYTGGGEPSGDSLDQAWFTDKAATAQRDHCLYAIYATSFRHTDQPFPLAWNEHVKDVYAINVTDRYTKPVVNKMAFQGKDGFDVEASLHAVDQLKTYLQTPRSKRAELSEELFADVALTRDDARQARQLLWDDHVSFIRETRAEEMKSRRLDEGERVMPFYYSTTGDRPENGRSLYISMHGGGGTTKEGNDSQWNNQKKLYQVPEGIYLAPRAPTDAWNLWHQDHIDRMFDRLIENMIVFEDVNPNRVYLLGYSAGGDGVYQLGPRMADRWAAASMMAGHPNDASPVNLYHTPFTIHMGANDAAYNRNEVAREWGQRLDELQKNEPGGYIHWTKIYPDRGHWVDHGGAEALPWLAQFTRNPLPNQIIWRQDKHRRFYWLAVNNVQSGGIVRAALHQQTIDVQFGETDELLIRVNDCMLDLDQAVIVRADGKTLFKGRIQRTIAVLAKTLMERGDPESIFSGEITISHQKESDLQN